jgi:hypothetical protein
MEIIRNDDKNYQECDIIMLPTDENSMLHLTKDNHLIDVFSGVFSKENKYYGKNQHLYILSNEKIEKGDWFYDSRDKILSNNPLAITHFSKKVIVTTDSSLKVYYDLVGKNGLSQLRQKSLQEIPQSFIEYFINEYNKGNVIKKVLVEVECKNVQIYPKSGKEFSDKNHLEFIYNRLINVHNENPDYDYMIKFKEILKNISQ